MREFDADKDACNCAAVRQAARQVTQLYDTALAGTGLRASQFSVLVRLRRNGPMTINALALELVMDRTTLSRNLLPLQRDGLVSASPLDSDRRSKALLLTRAGKRRLDAAEEAWCNAQRRFEGAVGRKRSEELRDELGSVVAKLREEVGAALDDG